MLILAMVIGVMMVTVWLGTDQSQTHAQSGSVAPRVTATVTPLFSQDVGIVHRADGRVDPTTATPKK